MPKIVYADMVGDDEPVTFERMRRTPRRDLMHRWAKVGTPAWARHQSECEGKRKHRTKRRPNRAVVAMEARDLRVFSVYRCSYCGQYHVGHAYTRYIRAGMRARGATDGG